MGKKLTTEDFIKKATFIHGNKYDYSLVNYINSKTKVEIICAIHGSFWQIPENHLAKDIRGCFQCGREKTNLAINARIISTEEFVVRAIKIHGNIFDYSKVNYSGSIMPVIIICKIHGEFIQSPTKHLNKQGCYICGRITIKNALSKNNSDFINQSNMIHNHKYNYDMTEYVKDNIKVKIICPIHKDFYQTPNAHIRGQGCPKCGFNISHMEAKWLDSLSVPNNLRNKSLKIDGKLVKTDAFDPITNTIYEFNGDFWHGNPAIYDPDDINPANKKTYGELYRNTLIRENLIKRGGYNLIIIWENDFKGVNDL